MNNSPFKFILWMLSLSIYIFSCQPEDVAKDDPKPIQQIPNGGLTDHSNPTMDPNIRSIFQDRQGNYWFGTNGFGVYRYDGKTLTQFTEKDGLSNNQVLSIQQEPNGNLWFGTGLFGVSRFDGQLFTILTGKNLLLSDHPEKEWAITPNDLWFCAGGGVYRYDGKQLMYLPLGKSGAGLKPTSGPPDQLSRYGVYSILKDRKGNMWFGTQAQGVCRYDGTTFTWFTEKKLAGPAVLALFEDHNGDVWFGTNGSGLFRYDGHVLHNFTEEQGLTNASFGMASKSGPGTLARIYSIQEDREGKLWVGTVDAGVWKYDGSRLTNYTVKDGLSSVAVNTIYKDRNGELWFGTDANGICNFNGQGFSKYTIQ